MKRIILASNSPRRKEILEQVGIQFEVIPSTSDEESDKLDPIEMVQDISAMKAREVANRVDAPSIIIGADTVVVHDGKVLGKPKDECDAKQMLQALQNSSHEVFTGVTVIQKELDEATGKMVDREITFADVSKVIIYPLSAAQIEQYVATKEPMDKAGAYAIQGKFAVYVKEIIGDYYNIVGLPISKLYNELLDEGIDLFA